MKSSAFLTVIVLFLFNSCSKKNEVVPVNTLSANINGVNMNFSTYANYSVPAASNSIQFNITATSNAANTPRIGISITAAKGVAITAGTYNNDNYANNPPPPYSVNIDYYYYQPIGGVKFYLTPSYNVRPINVTITYISDTNVQGTFNTILEGESHTDIATLSNGKFNVDISK